MSELKCPSCTQTVTSSFIRIGAVVTCAACDQTYRVTEAHMTRPRPASPAAAPADPLGEHAANKSPASPRLDDAGQVTGLSDLSESLDQAKRRASQRKVAAPDGPDLTHLGDHPLPSAPPQPAVTGSSTSEASPRRLARDQARQRSHRMAYLLAGGVGVGFAAVMLGLYLAAFQSAMPPAPRQGGPDQQQTPVERRDQSREEAEAIDGRGMGDASARRVALPAFRLTLMVREGRGSVEPFRAAG